MKSKNHCGNEYYKADYYMTHEEKECCVLDETLDVFYVQLLTKSVVIVSMSFITLFIGMAMKSSKVTIVTSFLVIFLTQANVGGFSLAGNTIFLGILVIVSFVFAGLSICNAETKDLMYNIVLDSLFCNCF